MKTDRQKRAVARWEKRVKELKMFLGRKDLPEEQRESLETKLRCAKETLLNTQRNLRGSNATS